MDTNNSNNSKINTNNSSEIGTNNSSEISTNNSSEIGTNNSSKINTNNSSETNTNKSADDSKNSSSPKKRKYREFDEFNYLVGERIRMARSTQGMNQKTFAKKLGITPQYLGRFERGEVSVNLKMFTKICEELNMSADYFLYDVRTFTLDNMDELYIKMIHRMKDKKRRMVYDFLRLIINANLQRDPYSRVEEIIKMSKIKKETPEERRKRREASSKNIRYIRKRSSS